MENWMDEYPEQYEWLESTDRVADSWRALPSLVEKHELMPSAFVHGSQYIVSFPKAFTAELSRRFPSQFEWLPVNVRGQRGENWDPPFVSALSQEVAALELHILHCIRPIRMAEQGVVEDFEPRGKRKKRDVKVFMRRFVLTFRAC